VRPIDYFDKGADAHPDRAAIVAGETSYTYREAREASWRVARSMWARGLRKEERVAIFSPNDPRVLLCVLGLLRSGGAWLPINPRNALDANVDYMNHVGAVWLFYHSSFVEPVKEIRARVPTLRHFVCLDAEEGRNPSLETFMEEGAEAEELDWADQFGNPYDLVGLFPTGGTTGAAKAVRIAMLPWARMTEMGARYWQVEGVEPVNLVVAPLTHAAGPISLTMFYMGATNVIMPAFDAPEVLRNIERHRVTHMFLPPTALYSLLAEPDVREFDYSSLRTFLLVASPVAPDKLRQAVEVFGPCMCQCYGQVESPLLLTWLDQATVAAAAAGEHPERLQSCGRATYPVRLAIMDDDGALLPAGERGEIVVRSNLVNPGYYENPEASAALHAGGWHHTGDVGYVDGDGFFYIVDRKKDMIISGGFNVYSAEVEAAVLELAQVRECAVIGIPHEKWGETVTAVVVPSEGDAPSEDEVIAHCKAVDELPKTAAAKLDKKAIRERYWSGSERSVH
jgi:fatty-acyl-CoA synthase